MQTHKKTAVVRVHRYRVDPDQISALLTRRAILIDEIRSTNPGLTETRLSLLDDGSYNDTWRWESAEHMLAAIGNTRNSPLINAAMTLTTDATAQNGEVIDER